MNSANGGLGCWAGVWILLSGLCVGWMVGLSISPVLQTVLTSVLAVVTGLVTVAAGLSVEKKDGATPEGGDTTPATSAVKANPAPVMLLSLGIALGASLGVHARTNLFLGPNGQWLASRTGLTAQEIYRRAFLQVYAPPSLDSKKEDGDKPASKPGGKTGGGSTETGGSAAGTPGLHSQPIALGDNICRSLQGVPDADLASELQRQTDDPRILAFARKMNKRPEALRAFVEEVLCKTATDQPTQR